MKKHFILFPILFSFIFFLLLSVACTRTAYIPVGNTRTDKQHAESYQRDSIVCSDTLRLYTRGDTVYSESIRTYYRNCYLRDTLCIHRIDSVPYPVEVVTTIPVTPRWAWYTLVISVLSVIISVLKILKARL